MGPIHVGEDVLHMRVIQFLPPRSHLRRHVLVLGLTAFVQSTLVRDAGQVSSLNKTRSFGGTREVFWSYLDLCRLNRLLSPLNK